MYLGRNNSQLHELFKIIKAKETDIDSDIGSLINQTLHSMFCNIAVKMIYWSMLDKASFTLNTHTYKLCITSVKTLT